MHPHGQIIFHLLEEKKGFQTCGNFTWVLLFLRSYTLFSWDNFRKSFKTRKFYSQIPYSFINLTKFEMNPLNKDLYLELWSISVNNFDTETNFGRFPTTQYFNCEILTFRSKVMADWKMLVSLQITHENLTRANNYDTLLYENNFYSSIWVFG